MPSRPDVSSLSLHTPTHGIMHPADKEAYPECECLIKGFTTIAVAAGFVASIQAQLMSTTIVVTATTENDTVAFRAINSIYTSGLVIDILSAMLAFLTVRWLERLTDEERDWFEDQFLQRNQDPENKPKRQDKKQQDISSSSETIYYTWLALSLFAPMPLLMIGVACMMIGIHIYVWTQHSIVVAALVTLSSAATIPFFLGDFYIGRNVGRRKKVITRLSEMRGDW